MTPSLPTPYNSDLPSHTPHDDVTAARTNTTCQCYCSMNTHHTALLLQQQLTCITGISDGARTPPLAKTNGGSSSDANRVNSSKKSDMSSTWCVGISRECLFQSVNNTVVFSTIVKFKRGREGTRERSCRSVSDVCDAIVSFKCACQDTRECLHQSVNMMNVCSAKV
jgi:hypothetical protein